MVIVSGTDGVGTTTVVVTALVVVVVVVVVVLVDVPFPSQATMNGAAAIAAVSPMAMENWRLCPLVTRLLICGSGVMASLRSGGFLSAQSALTVLLYPMVFHANRFSCHRSGEHLVVAAVRVQHRHN